MYNSNHVNRNARESPIYVKTYPQEESEPNGTFTTADCDRDLSLVLRDRQTMIMLSIGFK